MDFELTDSWKFLCPYIHGKWIVRLQVIAGEKHVAHNLSLVRIIMDC